MFQFISQHSLPSAPLFCLRACLHGGGVPQVCKRDQIKMRDYMDKRVTPPKRVASPTWGPPPPCKQALKLDGEPVVPCISSYRETMVSHILISRSKPASVTPWRYTVWTLYLTTATTLRTSKLWILSTNITVTSCTRFNLRCKKWMKNERKKVIWPTPTLSRDGYLMEFRPKMFARS